MGTLTDAQIKHWIKAGDPVAKADGGGLTFTLSKGGTAACGSTVLPARRRATTLGRYPDIPLSKARKVATDERARIQRGTDVAREKQQIKRTAAAARSLKQLATDYMEKTFPRLAENTCTPASPIHPEHRRQEIRPPRGARCDHGPRCRDYRGCGTAVTKCRGAGVHGTVRRSSSTVSRGTWSWRTRAPEISVTAICGQRVPKRARLKLKETELRLILPALPSIGESNALAVKILLVTCTRIGELTRAEWAHVNLDQAEVDIRSANSKTGRGFTVPLPPPAVEWFRALETLACGSKNS